MFETIRKVWSALCLLLEKEDCDFKEMMEEARSISEVRRAEGESASKCTVGYVRIRRSDIRLDLWIMEETESE